MWPRSVSAVTVAVCSRNSGCGAGDRALLAPRGAAGAAGRCCPGARRGAAKRCRPRALRAPAGRQLESRRWPPIEKTRASSAAPGFCSSLSSGFAVVCVVCHWLAVRARVVVVGLFMPCPNSNMTLELEVQARVCIVASAGARIAHRSLCAAIAFVSVCVLHGMRT